MNLIKATAPVKETEMRTYRRVLRPARYKNSKDNEEKVLLAAEIQVDEKPVDVWAVYTTHGELTERHSFSSKESADNYFKGF